MKQLKYIGGNKPKGMIIEVEEKDIARLISSGDYEPIDKLVIKKVKEEKHDINIKHTK